MSAREETSFAPLAIGALVFGGVMWALTKSVKASPDACTTKAYRDKFGTSSARDGGDCAHPGIASNPQFHWFRQLEEGDNPRSIAALITGDENRYIELMDANPGKATLGDRANPNSTNYRFAEFKVGEQIATPLSWNPYIDETGSNQNPPAPFPTK